MAHMMSSHNEIRIAIVGTSGSGKTTLAKQLCEIFHCPHLELDAYAWNPGWIKKEDDAFVKEIIQAVKQPSWVTCGNYSITRDIIWKKATHLVWLALPLRVILWRTFKRTLKNILTKRIVAGGNTESFYQQFFSKKSIFLWVLQTHGRRKREYLPLLSSGKYDPLNVLILKSQKEIDQWIQSLKTTSSSL
jgi:adenylate kinase family enzyme